MLRALAILLVGGSPANAETVPLSFGHDIHLTFGPSSEADATIYLRRGESADIAVVQQGIDIVVQVRSPNGTLLDEIDSPNGRNGDEPVSIYARDGGSYHLSIRPISRSEPEGAITFQVRALRTVGETARVRRQQAEARRQAAAWLRRDDAPLTRPAALADTRSFEPFDRLAVSAQVIGLGEASHGSRELNDVRLALVKRLVARHGFRIIAIEDSAARWRALEPFVAGTDAVPALAPEWGWIGRRSRKELLDWARAWNLAHPSDRIRIIGVDPQDNPQWSGIFPALLGRAYGDAVVRAWQPHATDLIAADEQTAVFGDSGVALATRDFVQGLLARIVMDEPLLRSRLGNRDYDQLRNIAEDLAAFADFNSGNSSLAKSRDWYMALAVLRALDNGNSKAVYWGHNSHVAAFPTSWGPTGALLRNALGCGYRAIATTFGEGSFLAQIPSDPADRLKVTVVPQASESSVEAALAEVRPGAHIAAWACGDALDKAPVWLSAARPMRWVGGLYAPDSAPSASFRPYKLTDAFDAVVYLPKVTAEADPGGRPAIPARKR